MMPKLIQRLHSNMDEDKEDLVDYEGDEVQEELEIMEDDMTDNKQAGGDRSR